MKNIYKIMNISFWLSIILIITFAIYNYIDNNNRYKIKQNEINIKNLNFISKDEVIEQIKIHTNNKNIFLINESYIKNILIENFFIEDVEIIKKTPNYIEIKINEIDMLLLSYLPNDKNKKYFINENCDIKDITELNHAYIDKVINFYNPIKIKYDSLYLYKNPNDEIFMLDLFQKNTPNLFTEINETVIYNDSIIILLNSDTKIKFPNSDHKQNLQKFIGFIEMGLNTNRKVFSINDYEIEKIDFYINERAIFTPKKGNL